MMAQLPSLHTVARALGQTLSGSDVPLSGISIDSRTLERRNLFFALRGPNFDGHTFLANAIEKGAAGLVVETPDNRLDVAQIIVKDTRAALGQLAAFHRKNFADIPTIAITGSCGKTTVKEMTSAILGHSHCVLFTQGNLNNDLGAPLTLLRFSSEYDRAVIELGANHMGEIAYTVSLTQPQVAMITNVGAAHLEGFGSVDNIMRAKSEIFTGLDDNGTAVLNADDAYFNNWFEHLSARGLNIVTFGQDEPADFYPGESEIKNGQQIFTLHTPEGPISITLAMLGLHNRINLAAAAAAAHAVGATVEDIIHGARTIASKPGRSHIYRAAEKTVIDDSYNANLSSVQAAIDLLASYDSLPKILVLGDIGELGDEATDIHKQLGLAAKTQHINHLISVGELARHASQAFGEGGLHCQEKDDVVAVLDDLTHQLKQPVILVKGSRFMKMETVVKAILDLR